MRVLIRSSLWALTVGVLAGALPLSGCAASPSDDGAEGARTFGVYALSRGKGVPPAARSALDAVAAIVEEDRKKGIAVESERTRIGIEGEFRLCVEYEDVSAAARALKRIREVVEGVDLVNIEIESCMPEGETS